MTRPRTPTAVLDARGAFRRHPERKRAGEPEVRDPVGNAPEILAAAERAWWDELVRLAPLGVLTSADRPAVLLAAKLMAEAMADFTGFSSGKLARLQSLLGAFGMTPSDRARLAIPKAQANENPFAHLDD